MRPFHIASTDPTTRVHLHSGRIIRLERLMRDRTFLNVGEASPTQDIVDLMAGGALLEAPQLFHRSGPAGGPLLAPPELLTGPWSAGPDEVGYLPPWVSYGLFVSDEPTKEGEEGDMSQLIVVWYQDYAQPLMDGGFLHWLQRLDWDAHAKNLWCD